MTRKGDFKGVRVFCGVIFLTFAVLWLCLFQGNLIDECWYHLTGRYVMGGMANFNYRHLILPFILAVLITLIEIPVARLLRLRDGLIACNYLISAILLGLVAGFDGHEPFSQDMTVWIISAVFSVLLLIICKVIQTVPRQAVMNAPRVVSGNLLILSLLFCLTVYLGNTDENYHRKLQIEQLVKQGKYEKALQIGRYEEETDSEIILWRVDAMLHAPAEIPGSVIGERMFQYPMPNSIDQRSVIASLMAVNQDDTPELAQNARLAAYLLECRLKSFTDYLQYKSTLMDRWTDGSVPRYFMQALVIANDTIASERFPRQFKAEQECYESFQSKLEPIKTESKQFQANTTYINFHETYFWFYTFH